MPSTIKHILDRDEAPGVLSSTPRMDGSERPCCVLTGRSPSSPAAVGVSPDHTRAAAGRAGSIGRGQRLRVLYRGAEFRHLPRRRRGLGDHRGGGHGRGELRERDHRSGGDRADVHRRVQSARQRREQRRNQSHDAVRPGRGRGIPPAASWSASSARKTRAHSSTSSTDAPPTFPEPATPGEDGGGGGATTSVHPCPLCHRIRPPGSTYQPGGGPIAGDVTALAVYGSGLSPRRCNARNSK